MEEAIAVTAYMDLFLRKIAEPRLLRIFLRFLLLGKMEDVTVLDGLVQRITSANTRLCMVTLALFKTLVDLNCEDVMFQLVFKYLQPCTHIMVSQQRSVTDVDVYGRTAEKLISLIPPSCIIGNHTDNGCTTTATTMAEDVFNAGTQWTNRLTNSICSTACDSSLPSPISSSSSSPSPFQRSRQWFSFRSKSRPTISESASATVEAKGPAEAKNRAEAKDHAEAKCPAEDRRVSVPLNLEAEPITPTSSASPRTSSQWESSSSPPVNARQWESSYVDYLQVARVSIEECIAACRNWSSQYRASEVQTLSSISSPSSSAPTDPFSSSDALDSGGDVTVSETISPVSDENPGAVSPAIPVSKRHEDLLSFLVQLNRVQLPETSDESEDILTEFDQLLSDAREYGFFDVVIETPDFPIRFHPQLENTRHNSGVENAPQILDNVVPEASVLESLDVKNEVTSVELDLKETKMAGGGGGAYQSIGLNKRYVGLMSGSPTIGPFLTALLNKLEAMKQNSLYVNLQLTGLITRLACYPQPLLSSLLLSHTLVFQPSIKSLMQVLNTIKCRTEEFLYKLKEKDQMLEHAYNYLLWRLTSHERTDSEDKSSSSSRRSSLMTLNSPKPPSETKMSSVMSRLKLLDNKRGAYYTNKQPKTVQPVARETQEMVEKKNAIYCAVVFKEFLKELAAISQEHAFLLTKEAS